jgi:hypothetical protein
VSDLEAAHGAALFFQIGEGFQTVFGLEAVQAGVSLPELGVQGSPARLEACSRAKLGVALHPP